MTNIDRGHPALQMMECTSEGCGLRYPQAIRARPLVGCPRCGGSVRVAAQYGSAQQTQRTIQPRPLAISLLLDNIRSAHNVGSMLRTADGASVQHVYLCGVTPTPEHVSVRKTALGAEQLLPWSYHPNGAELAVHLKTENHLLCAIEGSGDAVSMFEEPSIDGKTHGIVLVIGNEISGVDPGILAQCARRWFLPMLGAKRSLNVAVACGIALYQLRFGVRG
ncbi:MAG: TrmH family RNA methyltransferase [Caldilineaceae bacterium]